MKEKTITLSERLDISRAGRCRLFRGAAISLLAGIALAACSAEPGNGADSGNGSETGAAKADDALVTVYWNTGTSDVIHRTTVRRSEVNEMLALRASQRRAAELGQTADIARSQEALTTGSTDWANVCKWYNSFLVTSAADAGGDFFCAVYSEPFSSTGIAMPFVPQWYDRSSTHWFSLCTDASNCFVGDGPCFGLPPPVWNAYSPGSGGGNISPPSNVLYINSQVEPFIC